MASTLHVASSSINPYITCTLCNGYFRQPYTVRECIHTFCKSCIFKHIVTQDKRACPVCEGPFGTYPLSGTKRKPPEIVQDHAMEGLVKKLLAKLDVQDAQDEVAFYAKHDIPHKSNTATGSSQAEVKFKKLKGKQLRVVLRPELKSLGPPDGSDESAPLRRKHFTYLWQLTERYRIFDVKILLRKMLRLRGRLVEPQDLEVRCAGQLLGKEHTLIFIQKAMWKKDGPITLEYRRVNASPT
ncbi:hypothetical protein SDRG_06909 [Saprolegnia diclina VS20]|uniref:RING-type domain-containing protein n=1 Tax=Saprolegnia diclina (strain VS20) TaxID=1156394 RepID=T0QP45_SAPDV|nr:hypothetical protein SDRG_06909 [Saprolegnia diclina VS20]EQC35625.1 hypothetical protein SDRG_06909 [Saprolegnia diclina VS20]|eukprot:XP_008610942.1 hypothetical protein SDRG_06909 [Saprolegnia diclina VS20]